MEKKKILPQVPARIEKELLEATKKQMKKDGIHWRFLMEFLLNRYIDGRINIR